MTQEIKMLSNKELIPVGRVPGIVEKLTGIRCSRATLYNWLHKGRLDKSGEHVYLNHVEKMGHLFTTQANIEEFIRRVS